MTDQKNNAPWYKNYMITVFVIGLPAFVVIVCLFFIFYSIKIKDATVRDDWYMDGKTLYQDASKDQLAFDLNLSGVMRFDGETVNFSFNQPPPAPLSDTLKVNVSHATDASKDRDFELKLITDNQYQGTVSLDPTPAKYYLHINSDDGWRLTQTQKLPANNIIFMPLPAFDQANLTLPDQRDKRHRQNTPSDTQNK